MKQHPESLGFFERWLRKPWGIIRHRHNCLNCGFLSFGSGEEATYGTRLTISAEGKIGWFAKEDVIDCYKHLWLWDSGEAAVSIISFEANRPRFQCKGFHRYFPGRSPKQHMQLEDESREFCRRVALGLVAFFGALLGALIGAFFGRTP